MVILDNLCLYLSVRNLLRIDCNLRENKLTFQMERHKSQKDERQRISLYDIGAVHVVVILLRVVWGNDVTWRFSESTSTPWVGRKRHYQDICSHIQYLFYRWGKDWNFLNSIGIFPEELWIKETMTKNKFSLKNKWLITLHIYFLEILPQIHCKSLNFKILKKGEPSQSLTWFM